MPGTNITEHPIQLMHYICDITGVSYADITSRKRNAEIIDIRHIILYFMHDQFRDKYTLVDMANFVNLKAHSSVIHSLKVTRDLRQTDFEFKTLFETIEKRLKEK